MDSINYLRRTTQHAAFTVFTVDKFYFATSDGCGAHALYFADRGAPDTKQGAKHSGSLHTMTATGGPQIQIIDTCERYHIFPATAAEADALQSIFKATKDTRRNMPEEIIARMASVLRQGFGNTPACHHLHLYYDATTRHDVGPLHRPARQFVHRPRLTRDHIDGMLNELNDKNARLTINTKHKIQGARQHTLTSTTLDQYLNQLELAATAPTHIPQYFPGTIWPQVQRQQPPVPTHPSQHHEAATPIWAAHDPGTMDEALRWNITSTPHPYQPIVTAYLPHNIYPQPNNTKYQLPNPAMGTQPIITRLYSDSGMPIGQAPTTVNPTNQNADITRKRMAERETVSVADYKRYKRTD